MIPYTHVLTVIASLPSSGLRAEAKRQSDSRNKRRLNVRPDEGMRDAAEEIEHTVKDASSATKNAVENN